MSQDKQTLYSGRYLDLGRKQGWEYVIRKHRVVVIIAWTPDDELLLVEQFRIPIDRQTIELPAGLVGDEAGQQEESLHEAAGRELEEETGWRAGALRTLMRCPTSAGLTDEEVTFVSASELVCTGDGGGDDSEDIIVHRVARNRIDSWLSERHQAGLAIDPKIYTALYWSGSGGQPPANDNNQSGNR
jgi:ADP-ribose pyrophosphatase